MLRKAVSDVKRTSVRLLSPKRNAKRLKRLRDKLRKNKLMPVTAESAEVCARLNFVPSPDARYLDQSGPLRVLFISGDSASPSHIYRVKNMVRGLKELGCAAEAVPMHEFGRAIDRMREFHAVVFWRIALGGRFSWSGDLERAITDCEKHGVATFFDVDDLVFDPRVCNDTCVDGLRHISKDERENYDASVRGYRDLMVRCGNALLTTETLKERAQEFGVNAFVVPNGLDDGYEDALTGRLSRRSANKS